MINNYSLTCLYFFVQITCNFARQIKKTKGIVMNEVLSTIEQTVLSDYKYGFVTDIAADEAPKGLNESIIRFISNKKNEPQWMLDYRLKAYAHWLRMEEPKWPNVQYPPIDYQ